MILLEKEGSVVKNIHKTLNFKDFKKSALIEDEREVSTFLKNNGINPFPVMLSKRSSLDMEDITKQIVGSDLVWFDKDTNEVIAFYLKDKQTIFFNPPFVEPKKEKKAMKPLFGFLHKN